MPQIDKKLYYRVPFVLIEKDIHYSNALVMRLLAFIFKLNMKAQSSITPIEINNYSKRHENSISDTKT